MLLFVVADMNMQWNIDLSAPPTSSTTRRLEEEEEEEGNEIQECEPPVHDGEASLLGCSPSTNPSEVQTFALSNNGPLKNELPMPPLDQVQEYANNAQKFFDDFSRALSDLSKVGYGVVGQVPRSEGKYEKLGMLRHIDLSTCPSIEAEPVIEDPVLKFPVEPELEGEEDDEEEAELGREEADLGEGEEAELEGEEV